MNYQNSSNLSDHKKLNLKTDLFQQLYFNKLFEFEVQKLTSTKIHTKTMQQIMDDEKFDTKIPKVLEYLLENVDLVLSTNGIAKNNYFKLCNTFVKKALVKQSKGELDGGTDTVYAKFLKEFSEKLLENEGFLLKLYG